jgi:transposase
MSASEIVPLGIDISKGSFDVALLKERNRVKRTKFDNTAAGFAQLSEWLESQDSEPVHACMEATNTYGHALARYLYHQGHQVSIVNPARIKGYGKSQLSRTKNDAADAALIARFCRDLKPTLWHPAPDEVAKLQALTRRLEALDQMMTQEKNRRELCDDDGLRADIDAHIEFMEAQETALKKRLQQHIQAHDRLAEQQVLLESITGVGTQTAVTVLGEIGSIETFGSARQ